MSFPWFGKKPDPTPDPLVKSAQDLIKAANVIGITSYTQFAIELPIVNKINTEQWDWVFTVATVFIAVNRLHSLNLENSTEDKLLKIISQNLASWKPDALAGYDDCKTFFDRTYDALAKSSEYKSDDQFLASDALGSWMAWNLLGHASESEDERKLVRMAGAFVVHSFFDWWPLT